METNIIKNLKVVEEMRRGKTPTEACKVAINRITIKYPEFQGAVVAVNNKGVVGMYYVDSIILFFYYLWICLISLFIDFIKKLYKVIFYPIFIQLLCIFLCATYF